MDKNADYQSFDAIVAGAGFAGATIARELAERGQKQVLVIDRREHPGGNAYDHLDSQGVLVHAYGPHIFHTNSERVFDYLSRFTDWNDYQHQVVANIDGQYIPVPFNLNSLAAVFSGQKGADLLRALLDAYPLGTRVGILDLKATPDPLLAELSDYIYSHIFEYYTMKQWGLAPDQIDPSVTARVPVLVDYDNRYFQDTWQGLPRHGYTALFESLLDHPNIELQLGVDACDLLAFSGEKDESEGRGEQPAYSQITVQEKPYKGLVIYTGALDELLDWRFGILPYRSLNFVNRQYDQKHVQPTGTVNFTVSEDYTRTTEYTWMTQQEIDVTTVTEEYPCAFEDPKTQIPYYPVNNDDSQAAYQRYLDLVSGVDNLILLGRLAEYRYYNIDQVVLSALQLADRLLTE